MAAKGGGGSTVTVALMLGGGVLIYSAFKGENPLDVLASTFTGKALAGSLRSSAGGTTSVTPPKPGTEETCGILELLHPGNDADHQDHGHLAHESVTVLVTIGLRLMAQGFSVTEHPAFGGVRGSHDPDGWHYKARAFDFNKGAGESAAEKKAIIAVVPTIRKWACELQIPGKQPLQ